MPSKSTPIGFKNKKSGGRPKVPAGIPESFKKGGHLGNHPPRARQPPKGKPSA
jgi:hypothetical protein